MTQNVVDFSDNPTGAELMDDYLFKEQENILTSNSGIQRPSYAVAGTKWLDTSVTPWVWKMYDGTSDITLGTVNSSTHLFTPSGVLPSQEGQTGKFLQTDGSKTLWKNAVDHTNITNCITKIPQDIKLELNNGTLTLKAGSKVYVPNGVGVFDAMITNADITREISDNGTYFISLTTDTVPVLAYGLISNCFSNNTAPSSTYSLWYNTASNIIQNPSGNRRSFPIAIVTVSGGKITSIDQVFNGFGYIGSTFFVLPGVEGLSPNGRNSDGSLNNTKFTTTYVITNTYPDVNVEQYLLLNNTSITGVNLNSFVYDEENNYIIYTGDGTILNGFVFAKTEVSSGLITMFNPKTTFRASDYQDVPKLESNNTFSATNIFNNTSKIILEDLGAHNFTMKQNQFDVDNKQGNEYFGIINFTDKNNKQAARWDVYTTSSTNTRSRLLTWNKNNQAAQLLLDMNDNGTASLSIPTPPAGDNSTKAATTAWVKSNAVESGTNYIKFGNGQLICWGRISGTSGTAATFTITFPKPFADKNWCLSFTPIQGSWDYGWYVEESSIETTGCIIKSRNGSTSGMYIVIGKGA